MTFIFLSKYFLIFFCSETQSEQNLVVHNYQIVDSLDISESSGKVRVFPIIIFFNIFDIWCLNFGISKRFLNNFFTQFIYKETSEDSGFGLRAQPNFDEANRSLFYRETREQAGNEDGCSQNDWLMESTASKTSNNNPQYSDPSIVLSSGEVSFTSSEPIDVSPLSSIALDDISFLVDVMPVEQVVYPLPVHESTNVDFDRNRIQNRQMFADHTEVILIIFFFWFHFFPIFSNF